LPEKSNIQISYIIYISSAADTTISYELEVINSNNKVVHFKSNTKFIDINEHFGSAEWDDSTIFYCEEGGDYQLLFSFNGTESDWGEAGLPDVSIQSVKNNYVTISLLLGISSIFILGVSNLLNLNILVRNRKKS
jgi:hypothetical protein